MRRALIGCTTFVFALSFFIPRTASPAEAQSRTVYVTVVDKDGGPVPGLTPADFRIKEGGKQREIVSVEPATAHMHIALMVEEILTPQGGVRLGLGEFVKRMYRVADISLIVVAQRNETAVDYTSDPNALIAGINNFPLSLTPRQNKVPEGVYEIARKFEESKPERPVIVLVALEMQQASSQQPDDVLNHLAQSGAELHVVSMQGPQGAVDLSSQIDMSGRSKVMGDGSRQSGGRRVEVSALTAFPKGLQDIADYLSSQYRITYTLPDGVKPSNRLDVSLNKKGLTLRAPTRIPK